MYPLNERSDICEGSLRRNLFKQNNTLSLLYLEVIYTGTMVLMSKVLSNCDGNHTMYILICKESQSRNLYLTNKI